MKCEIDNARMFLQVIRELRDPLAILREALSNSYDAGASRARIELKKQSVSSVRVEVHDNGKGITPKEFRFFFGLGFGNKAGKFLIGNKGLGTKLFFSSERVEVFSSLRSGGCYHAVLDEPMVNLERDAVPEYVLRRISRPRTAFRYGTSIVLRDVPANSRAGLLSSHSVVNHLKWFTVAGSCARIFGIHGARQFSAELKMDGVETTSHVVRGHDLPGVPRSYVTDSVHYAAPFNRFSLSLESDDGISLGTLQVAGAIVGPGGHIVADRKVKKRYKGVFLAKNYFIVRSVNDEVFGGTGEWQNVHIVANCQELELSMSRDMFTNTGPSTPYSEAISALRMFANSLRRGDRFRYRGRTIETGEQYAGALYSQFRSLRQGELEEVEAQTRALGVLALSELPRTVLQNDGGPLLAPSDKIGVLMTFQALVSRGHRFRGSSQPRKGRAYRVLGYSGGPEGFLVVQRKDEGRWSVPLLYRAILDFRTFNRTEFGRLDGLVCWSTDGLAEPLPASLDVVALQNALHLS